MKPYWTLIATLLVCGCVKVPESSIADMEAADMGGDDNDVSVSADAAANNNSTDAGSTPDGGSIVAWAVPFPTYSIGIGGSSSFTVRQLRRRLMYRFNAELFIGSTAQVVGRLDEFDAVFVDSGDEIELAPLETAEIPVFLMTSGGSERLGLTDELETWVPIVNATLTQEHPRPAAYQDIELIDSGGEVFVHRAFAPDALVFAEAETETETLPLMVGVETDAALLNDLVAPARRTFFGLRSLNNMNPAGYGAFMDAVQWTYEFEHPTPDKTCGVIVDPNETAGYAFGERLLLHSCEVRYMAPDAVNTSGLDLIVVAPENDQVSIGQLLAPQDIPVIAFYDNTSLPRGLEIVADDTNEQVTVSSIDVQPLAGQLLGTPAAGTLDFMPQERNLIALPTDGLADGVQTLATYTDGQPAVLAVDRGVTLSTLETGARWVIFPSAMVEYYEFEGNYSPTAEATELIDYAIEWVLSDE